MQSPLGVARTLLRSYRKKRFAYEPLIEIRIDAGNILHNYRAFKELTKKEVAPVLKSNAYGHGLSLTATTLESEGAPFFCVDSLFEALILRNEGVETPILIIGYTPIRNILKWDLPNVSFAVISLEELARMAQMVDRDVQIHLKFDTGMHRHGMSADELDDAVALVDSHPHLQVQGVYTHFADADTPHSPHTAKQIEQWSMLAARIRETLPGVAYFHCAATAGSAYASDLDMNVVRLGIGLYGVNAGAAKIALNPALEMRSRITSLRTLKKGEHIGYNATFLVGKEMRIATIPAGYNEGVDRRLSNEGAVLMNGYVCPIVGRVSMNITSIDVTNVPNAALDDEVIVISRDPKAPNSIENIARTCGTIPYEIFVHIPAHIRRTVV